MPTPSLTVSVIDLDKFDAYMDAFRVLERTRLSDDYLEAILERHPNPIHIIDKYRQSISFTAFILHCDPITAAFFFAPLFDDRAAGVPYEYPEFRRFIMRSIGIERWHALAYDSKLRIVHDWETIEHVPVTSRFGNVWETLAPRGVPVVTVDNDDTVPDR